MRTHDQREPAPPERDSATAGPQPEQQQPSADGRPSDLADLASRMGNQDFSQTVAPEGDAGRDLGASAFSSGQDVHFGGGQESSELLPHEAAHTVQQGR